jgi:cytochrome c biogenesis protein CcmG, thiol:disulfide interchange protein DsbE
VIRARAVAVSGLVLATVLSGCTAERVNPDGPVEIQSTLMECPQQPADQAQGTDLLPPLSFECPGGGSLDLGRAPGVPTVVNLWGSWCPPCREEMPVLQQFADTAGDRVRVVGVISKDGLPQADAFAADAGVTFPGAFDGEGELMAELGLNVLPYTYFVDADGALAYTQVGPVRSVDELRGLVGEHLGVQL